MRSVVAALGTALERDLGIDAAAARPPRGGAPDRPRPSGAARSSRPCPPDRRTLVTGHESMGYFADRYGFELIGRDHPVAQLAGAGVGAHARRPARPGARGGRADDLHRARHARRTWPTPSATRPAPAWSRSPPTPCPDDGSYVTFMRRLAATVAAGLAPRRRRRARAERVGPLLDPFLDNEFMQRALLAGVLVADRVRDRRHLRRAARAGVHRRRPGPRGAAGHRRGDPAGPAGHRRGGRGRGGDDRRRHAGAPPLAPVAATRRSACSSSGCSRSAW